MLVIVEGGEAEALHEPTSPGSLLARGTVAGTGIHISKGPVRLEAGRAVEAGADDHILVGKGEHGASQQLGHEGTQDRVALAGSAYRRQSDDHARGAADAFERREGKALQAATVAGGGSQDPVLALLGQQADAQGIRPDLAEFCHVLDLGIAEHRTVLGLDLDRHRLRSLALGRFTSLATKRRALTGRGDCRTRPYSLPSQRVDPNPAMLRGRFGSDKSGPRRWLSRRPRPRHPTGPVVRRLGPPRGSRSSRRGAEGPVGLPGGGRPRHRRGAPPTAP